MESTTRHSWDGYEHLFVIPDLWQHIGIKAKFPAWFAKNWSLIETFQCAWQVPAKHVIRTAGYKGQLSDVTSIQGLKHDVASVVGLLLLFGSLLQIRGLSLTIQQNCLKWMRSIISMATWPNGLAILPDLILEVEDGQVSFMKLCDALPRNSKLALKNRLDSEGGVSSNTKITTSPQKNVITVLPFFSSAVCGKWSRVSGSVC